MARSQQHAICTCGKQGERQKATCDIQSASRSMQRNNSLHAVWATNNWQRVLQHFVDGLVLADRNCPRSNSSSPNRKRKITSQLSGHLSRALSQALANPPFALRCRSKTGLPIRLSAPAADLKQAELDTPTRRPRWGALLRTQSIAAGTHTLLFTHPHPLPPLSPALAGPCYSTLHAK